MKMDWSGKKRTLTLQRNPLLINTVINCIFECLPLKYIKKCRVVCKEWNSVAIKILNKQSEVNLDSNERLKNFLKFFKVYNTLVFPSTTFHLEFPHKKWSTEEYKQLAHFFNTLRGNIINLTFKDSSFTNGVILTPLIEIATSLVSLTISGHNVEVDLDKLAKVKYLSLTDCCVSLDSFKNRIAPLSIRLSYVTFHLNENVSQEFLITDYIDFSACSVIEILPFTFWNCSTMTFDMSRGVVSARRVYLDGVRVINWKAKPATVNKRMLSPEKHTGMGIKELTFRCSVLNLSALPKSLEKLTLDENTYGQNNCVALELPNLKRLIFKPLYNATTGKMSPKAYDMGIIISMFRLCPKLVDMELSGCSSNDWRCDINVDLLPVSLKRIKLSCHRNINLVGDTAIRVDILKLDWGTFADAQKFMNKIKPKIVLVHLQRWEVEDAD